MVFGHVRSKDVRSTVKSFYIKPRLGFGSVANELLNKAVPAKYSFSCKANHRILNQVAKDIGDVSGDTMSGVIESALIRQLLPDNEKARHYVSLVNLGEAIVFAANRTTRYGISDALSEIFADISAGTSWEPRYHNAYDFVLFAKDLAYFHTATVSRNADEAVVFEMNSCFDSVCNVITYAADDSSNGDEVMIRHIAESGRAIYQRMLKNDSSAARDAVGFIERNYRLVENSTWPFRFLACFFSLVDRWDDSATERIKFAEICEKVMSEWTAEQAKLDDAQAANEKEREAATMQFVQIANGASACMPSNWLLANPEDAPSCDYVGVLEVRNGGSFNNGRGITPIAFFSNQFIPEIGRNTKEYLSIIEKAMFLEPELEKVIAAEVELEYGEDGGVLNAREYAAAPEIGMFLIWDEGEYPLGDPPYGAFVRR